MDRFKNYGLWVSIFALIPLLCEAFGVDVIPTNYSEIIEMILAILVTAGIVSNPKEGKCYLDKCEKK